MKTQIKKIDVVKSMIVSGYLTFALVFVSATIVSIALFVMYQVVLKTFNFADLIAGILGGLFTAVLLGALNSLVLGFIVWLYNLGARFFGGIVIETQTIEEKKSTLFVDKDGQ